MVGIITRRVRRDIRIINRIFNRMLIMVIVLNRVIIDLKWMVRILWNIEEMVIRMSIIMVRSSYQYCHLKSQD